MATRRNRRFVVMVLSTLCIITSGMVFSDTNGKRGEKLKSGTDHPLKEMLKKDRKVPKKEYVPGEILVKVKKGSRAVEVLKRVGQTTPKNDKAAEAIESNLELILKKHGAKAARQIFKDADVSGKSKSQRSTEKPFKGASERSDLGRWYHIRFPEETNLDEIIQALADEEEVEAAESNGEWRLCLPDATTDPGYAQQWHFGPAKVRETWQYLIDNGIHPGGTRGVVVAVVDSGVDYTHGDLVGNMWVNGGEIAGNGFDDDDNGFVDDVHGCSVAYDSGEHSGDPLDVHGHGTHVAGIVAATAYNQIGGVGVAFNVQMMAIRVAQSSGTLTYDDIAEGIMYAVDNGADVINMSFGGFHKSQIIEDALSIAFSQSVLVAAAGNGNGVTGYAADSYPFYPAAYPWVLGVMASDQSGKLAKFTNYDNNPLSNFEYEVAAPGVDIYSTLPGNQYAAWDGTSMAAPIVAGSAALIRSVYPDRYTYSSRFIMGQISSTTSGEKGGTPNTVDEPSAPIVDPPGAITTIAKPDVRVSENWVFDDEEISPNNNGDGGIDSGETIHLAIELMNMQGAATNVSGTLATTDAYVTIPTPTAAFDSMGPVAVGDNGLIYDLEGLIVGVDNPLVFVVDSQCPNGHIVEFDLTINYENGWDLNDPDTYTKVVSFQYVVLRGRDLPTIISQDLEMTADDYWLVKGPVLIEPGATVTVHPGTQIQWGGISDDPYNPGPQNGDIVVRGTLSVEGSALQPVSMFPSYLVSGQTTKIAVDSNGNCNLKYAKVRNPEVSDITEIDQCYFDWDAYNSTVDAAYIHETIFHKMRSGGSILAKQYNTCLFDAGWLEALTYLHSDPRYYNKRFVKRVYNTVFLQDNENNHSLVFKTFSLVLQPEVEDYWASMRELSLHNGQTYARIRDRPENVEVCEAIANYFGGHVATVSDSAENDFLISYASSLPSDRALTIGLIQARYPRAYEWIDGTPLTFSNWDTGYPKIVLDPDSDWVVAVAGCMRSDPVPNTSCEYSTKWREVKASGSYTSMACRLPGVWTEEQLREPHDTGEMYDFVRANAKGRYRWNAFLNKYWDPDLNHWMRIYGPNYGSTYEECFTSMRENFWGTVSNTLIDHAIFDYQDDFVTGRVEYGTPPPQGYESTYPFVERVLINGEDVVTVPTFGAGSITFTVTFNRDMDTNVHPFVTFGPAVPYTDFLVQPLNNGWTDARTWKGTQNVTPVTGDGYHLIRASGAIAADDPWLVSGYDVGRFRFKVQTMGVAAMTLQASGGEGQVELMWQQDDFDLLAGYNVYRSASVDGTYERLNATIVPVGQETYTDTDVLPAVPMYYKFTVVQTDMAESAFSNVASAAAVDTIAPVMTHVPVTSAPPSSGLRLTAVATDNVRVSSVRIFYRAVGSVDEYQSLAMLNISGNEWSGTIPGSWVQPPGVEYYIVASDGISEVYSGTPAVPNTVSVANVPSVGSVTPNHGPAAGGTLVTLSGTLFQDGASVFFGEMLAADVVVLSANQITCTTPAHFPAMVDVRVVNPDETEFVRLNGFLYEDTGVVLSMPTSSADYGTMVELELSVSNVTGMRAADATILFDASVLGARSVRTGTLTAGWSMSENTGTAGRVTISLANATAVSGTGSIARITFEVVGTPPASTALTISSAVLNDGAIEFDLSDGSFDVNGFFAISGTVSYFGGGYVPGVGLTVAGAGSYSDVSNSNGGFSIGNIPTGSYSLRPSKIDDANEITAYDASLVLQSSAGVLTLSGHQTMAADVNRNGLVNAMDASYILEKSVELRGVPFPGAGKVWAFDPGQRDYPLLNSNQSGQGFTGVLIGDVSGNWQAIVGSPLAGKSKAGSLVPPVRLSLGDVSGGIGERIVVPMEIVLGEAELYAANLTVTYDATRVSLEGVVAGSITEGMAAVDNTLQDGLILIGLAGSEPLTEDGILFEMSFRVLPGPRGETNISISVAQLNEGTLPADVVDGSVTITLFLGDIEPDGDVDVDDFAAIAGHWGREDCDEGNGWCEGTDFAPNGADGAVNFKDIVALAENWLSGVVW